MDDENSEIKNTEQDSEDEILETNETGDGDRNDENEVIVYTVRF